MVTKEYGRKELERIGYFKEGDDPYNDWAANAILELLEVFDNQGHSGFTAPYVAQMFHRLAMFKPIAPLTGEDDEWNEVGHGIFQNKRHSTVFKDSKDGRAYNIEGKIFSDDGGETWFTNRNSRVYIDFPYAVPEHPEKIILKEDNDAMFDGGLLMPDPYNGVTMIGMRSIFDHMVMKDCYEAGLMSEDEWKSYLKKLVHAETIKEDKDGE